MISLIISLVVVAYLISRFWVFICIPFRQDVRNIIHNYILQNKPENKKGKLLLDRLHQRQPIETEEGWLLLREHNRDHGHLMDRDGFIKKRKVNKLQFYLVAVFVWGFLDDDSSEDTTDIGYINSLTGTAYRTNGKDRSKKLPGILYGWAVPKFKEGDVVYGNALDLGDIRAQHPYFDFFATFPWNARNPFRNFKYLWMDY